MENEILDLANDAGNFIGECFDEVKPILDVDCSLLDPYVRFVIAQVYISCHLTSESALILAAYQKSWDAEMLTRSVMEGSFKFAYILNGSDAERLGRADQYWMQLPEIAAIKRFTRAQDLLNSLADPEAAMWRPIREIIVSDYPSFVKSQSISKKTRKAMEESWSVGALVSYFLATNEPRFRPIITLMHNYGASSHQIHKDGDGVGVVWERYQRSSEEQLAVSSAHAGRIISDVCAFAMFRNLELFRATCRDDIGAMERRLRFENITSRIKSLSAAFYNTEYAD